LLTFGFVLGESSSRKTKLVLLFDFPRLLKTRKMAENHDSAANEAENGGTKQVTIISEGKK